MSVENNCVTVTDHAVWRWYQRTSGPGFGPRTAWETAARVNPSHLEGDEIRYHSGVDCYLIARDDCLVTVVRADGSREMTPGRSHSSTGDEDEGGEVRA